MRPLKSGDVIISLSGGGAGVGRPEERDPAAVRLDVKNELVSLKAAGIFTGLSSIREPALDQQPPKKPGEIGEKEDVARGGPTCQSTMEEPPYSRRNSRGSLVGSLLYLTNCSLFESKYNTRLLP